MAYDSTDMAKLEQFSGKVVGDISGALGVILGHLGDKLGLYKALAEHGPISAPELAARLGFDERYLQEWLNANAAGGYIEYDPREKEFYLNTEQKLTFASEGHPAFMLGFFQSVTATFQDHLMVADIFKTGEGIPWGDHSACLFCGTERFFKPMYAANLLESWLPALDGAVDKLKTGAKVADIGCGHGSSTILMAKAFPNSTIYGYDFHAESIEIARERAHEEGVSKNTIFEIAKAKDFPEKDFDLITIFDALHDMGDPVGASTHIQQALKKDGSFMIVEPFANDDLEDNLNPLAQIYYAFSTMVCTPASKAQEVGLALGAQAGQKKLTEVLQKGGFTSVHRATETPTNIILEARP